MILRPQLLLHPNIPKPLHGIAPRIVYGREWWDVERRKAYAVNDQCCWACGVHRSKAAYHQWLEAHEIYSFDYEKGRLTFVELCALCHACHNYIHNGRMQALVDSGEMTAKKQKEILKHGKAILKAAGLPERSQQPQGKIASWGKWRMIIDGKEYRGKFKSFSEWFDYYNPDSNLDEIYADALSPWGDQ